MIHCLGETETAEEASPQRMVMLMVEEENQTSGLLSIKQQSKPPGYKALNFRFKISLRSINQLLLLVLKKKPDLQINMKPTVSPITQNLNYLTELEYLQSKIMIIRSHWRKGIFFFF